MAEKFSAGKSQNDTGERNSNCMFMMLSSESTAATQEQGHWVIPLNSLITS